MGAAPGAGYLKTPVEKLTPPQDLEQDQSELNFAVE